MGGDARTREMLELRLGLNRIGDAGMMSLARAVEFGSLRVRELCVGDTAFSMSGARALSLIHI